MAKGNGFIGFFSSDYNTFISLAFTTPLATALLCLSIDGTLFSGAFLNFVNDNRPSVQFAVQIIANFMSALQVITICRVINLSVRRRLKTKSMSLDQMRAWMDAMIPRINWDLPFAYIVLLGLLVSVSMVMSAIWAAAMTPVETFEYIQGTVQIPTWDNITHIREYPSEVGSTGPTKHTALGKFTYSVGIQMLGSLLASAASASPIHNSTRNHEKLDRTGYNYVGRSYGIGSSPGLGEVHFEAGRDILGWQYQEVGYRSTVSCTYNTSTNFTLFPEGGSMGWAAHGELPDSDDGYEHSTYIGHGDGNAIVAIGVAHFKDHDVEIAPKRRYIGFAAGGFYTFLNATQCEVDFEPTRFNVTVSSRGKNITVVPTNDTDVPNIDTTRWLKGTILRQFELIANDETNLYVSTVGTAFNASITDHRLRLEMNNTLTSRTSTNVTLEGIENSITAMVDDMLVAYASAQFMVGGFKKDVSGTIRVTAIVIGEKKFAIAAFALNMVVVALFILEAIRTRGWRDITEFDPSDIRHVMIAASEGGTDLAKVGFSDKNKLGEIKVRVDEAETGSFALAVDGEIPPTVKYESMRADNEAYVQRNKAFVVETTSTRSRDGSILIR
ncbi:uncharacterized protein FIESC28_03299 [Fusarium coffeatum]|uniref:Uncharacterized protein n=1 Tax=Fusarium coffeatum TaxID=231269 RepID=A0A366S3W7_9HYPO|nr:uncharacterized protein FIESC28_03299 [Fusarium coffeatum]RBR23989.1 hypothetical protein FIESC28_03299 [Fusarium coffeatum]